MPVNNVITAVFGSTSQLCRTCPIWQYDRGRQLKISGITLPTAYQVQFANGPTATAKPMAVCDSDTVEIPEEYTRSGEPVYAYVYITGDEYGITKRLALIPVQARGAISGESPTPQQASAIDALIDALNAGVTDAETAKGAAEQAADDAKTAQNAAETAQTSAETAASQAASALSDANAARDAAVAAKSASEAAQTAAEQSAANASTSASTATMAAGNASQSATDANTAKTGAETAKVAAENAAQSAGSSNAAAQTAKADTETAATSAQQSAEAAATAKGSAETAAESAEAAKTAAVTAQETAQSAAADAQSAQTGAETAETAAQAAQAAAEQAASVYDDIVAQLTDAATETTAQALLSAEDERTAWEGLALQNLENLIDALPADESLQDIRDELRTGNSLLELLYSELEEREANA